MPVNPLYEIGHGQAADGVSTSDTTKHILVPGVANQTVTVNKVKMHVAGAVSSTLSPVFVRFAVFADDDEGFIIDSMEFVGIPSNLVSAVAPVHFGPPVWDKPHKADVGVGIACQVQIVSLGGLSCPTGLVRVRIAYSVR